VDEIDLTKDQVVITAPMNGDYKEHFVGDLAHWEKTGEITGGQLLSQKQSGLPRLSHLIVWNLERPSSRGSVGEYAKESKSWIDNRLCDEVWVSDTILADETMLRYVTLGSDHGLGEAGNEKQYDFTHLSVPIPRRVHILKNFNGNQVGPNCWPPERDHLNIHQDNFPFCEPLRLALFAAYGLPIISEQLKSSYPYNGDIQQFPYHDLADGLKRCLNDDYEQWRERGLRLREKLCGEFQFGKIVRQAIGESVGIGWR
jgi:hypothetical protein